MTTLITAGLVCAAAPHPCAAMGVAELEDASPQLSSPGLGDALRDRMFEDLVEVWHEEEETASDTIRGSFAVFPDALCFDGELDSRVPTPIVRCRPQGEAGTLVREVVVEALVIAGQDFAADELARKPVRPLPVVIGRGPGGGLGRGPAEDAALAELEAGGSDAVDQMVRWWLLHERGEYCACYEEMQAYLERVDWHIEPPVPGEGSVGASKAARDRAVALGLVTRSPSAEHQELWGHDLSVWRMGFFWENTGDFVLGGTRFYLEGASDFALLPTMQRCLASDPGAQVEEVRRVSTELEARGLGDQVAGGIPPVPLAERLALAELALVAGDRGLDDAEQARLAALRRGVPAGSQRRWMAKRVREIEEASWEGARAHSGRGGLASAQVAELALAVATSDEEPFAVDDAACVFVLEQVRVTETGWFIQARTRAGEGHPLFGHDILVGRVGGELAALQDQGCVVGLEGTAETPEQALTAVAELGARRTRPTPDRRGPVYRRLCRRHLADLDEVTDPARLEELGGEEGLRALHAHRALVYGYRSLAGTGCCSLE